MEVLEKAKNEEKELSILKKNFSFSNEYLHYKKYKVIRFLGMKFKIKVKTYRTQLWYNEHFVECFEQLYKKLAMQDDI